MSSFSKYLRWKNIFGILKSLTKFFLWALVLFVVSTSIWVLYYKFYNPSITSLMKFRLKEAKQGNRMLKIQNKWCSYDKISINLKQSVVISEDSAFLHHSGFNTKAIRNAYNTNKKIGLSRYGSSTITQQTAKNLFLWNTRSWTRKILEAYFSVLIELFWDKKRILEVYLNIIEYGDGIFGIEAASRKYFNTSPLLLDKEQSSLIAVILPNPLVNSLENPSSVIIRKSKTNQLLVEYFMYIRELDKL